MKDAPHSRRDEVEAYRTRDGSLIRELMHPQVHGNRLQSLAEAELPVGGQTLRHRHPHSEELYHFTHGSGEMELEGEWFAVRAGETVCIDPGRSHALRNTGDQPLRLLCCCSPPYSHDDTELLE